MWTGWADGSTLLIYLFIHSFIHSFIGRPEAYVVPGLGIRSESQ